MAARRAGRPRRLKQLLPSAERLLQDTLTTFVATGSALPAALLVALTNGLAPPTWNRYLQALRPWRDYAAARGAAA